MVHFVDYRALNDCTADASWPTPNIAEMLRRIGSQKPKSFGPKGSRVNRYTPEKVMNAVYALVAKVKGA